MSPWLKFIMLDSYLLSGKVQPACKEKNDGQQKNHLEQGEYPHMEYRNNRHVGSVAPAVQQVQRNPFDNTTHYETNDRYG